MNSVDLTNEIIKEVEYIQDDVCLIMVSSHYPEKAIMEVAKLYDSLSNVWHTMREIRIALCIEIEKGFFRNPEIIGQQMTKEDFVDKIENIIKRLKHTTILLRDLSNAEPKFFDLGYTPRNILQAYQANNAWLTLEDVKRIIREK